MSEHSITIAMPAIPTLPEVEALKEICKVAAYSGFLSSTAPRNDMAWRSADAFFVVMYGRELGIPAMTALKTIYVVDGKPSCSGQALLSLMRRAGVEVEIPDPSTVTNSATVRIRRPGGEWRAYTYTEKMATKAGLWGKNTWAKYPAEMLIWRAVSTGNKYECSDITGGLYTIEELAPNTPLDADGLPVGDVVLEHRREAPLQLVSPPTEPEVSAEQPSAGVSDAGLGERSSHQQHQPAAYDDMPDIGKPASNGDAPNVYTCAELIVHKTRTATQYLVKTTRNTNINITTYRELPDLRIGETPVPALQDGKYPLAPAWRVQADLNDEMWEVHSIETEAVTA